MRTNVFPVVVLTVVMFVWCAWELVGEIFPLFSIARKLLLLCKSLVAPESKPKAVMEHGKPIRSR